MADKCHNLLILNDLIQIRDSMRRIPANNHRQGRTGGRFVISEKTDVTAGVKGQGGGWSGDVKMTVVSRHTS